MPIARQQLSKHIPEVKLSTTGHSSLGNGQKKTAFLMPEDSVFRGVSAEELLEGIVRRIERELKEYRGVREN
jgi:hypothetical protein